MIKIALVSRHAYGREGTPQYVTALARALATSHEVTIFSGKFEGLDGKGIRHRRVRTISSSGVLFDISFLIASTIMLWRSRLEDEFDIVHSHHYGSPFFVDVVTSHYCQQEGIDRVRRHGDGILRESFFWRAQRLGWVWIEKMLFGRRKSRPLIVVSEAMKRDFARHYDTRPGQIYPVHSGVDHDVYHPKNASSRGQIRSLYSLAEEDLLILFVGGDWVRKGLARAIEALRTLHSCRANLLILGHGDIATYRKMAVDLGVGEKVLFAEPIRENWMYYSASDVFLLPTLYEPFGLSILEAMASGLPVLVSQSAGAAELVEGDVNGLLLQEPWNVNEISEKLELLCSDGELRKRLGDSARRTAIQQTWSRVAQETVEVYQRIQDRSKEMHSRSSSRHHTNEGGNGNAS